MSDQEPVWLTPEQVEALRDACYSDTFQSWTHTRNDALIAVLADTGLRVGEVTQLRVEMLTDDRTTAVIPPAIQKTYQDSEPGFVRMGLGKLIDDVPRTLKSYLGDRWKDSPYLFPSRAAEDMSTQAVRNLVKKLAVEADVHPYKINNTQTDPERLHPHAFRHSIAYRMLVVDDEQYTLEDVQRRLRHARRSTTEDTYSHFLTV